MKEYLFIIILFVLNAVAHIISHKKLKAADSTLSNGVLAFVFINGIIALLLLLGINWVNWLAIIFPLIGGLALLFTTILKGKGTLIDYIILILDVWIIILLYFKMFVVICFDKPSLFMINYNFIFK